jgi:hypothetical protein
MTATDRQRLAAILGMLGSAHAGERAACYNGNAPTGGSAGASERWGGYLTPSLPWEHADAQNPPVPAHQHSGLGVRLQPATGDVTGGPAGNRRVSQWPH